MSPQTKKTLHIAAFVLVVIGAIDLGLFGIIPANANGDGFDLIHAVFYFSSTVQEIIYALIGISGIYLLVTHRKECKVCSK